MVDIDVTSLMWDLPAKVQKPTSVGNEVDGVNLKELVTDLLQRMSALELELVQLGEHNTRLDSLDKDISAHVLDERRHSSESVGQNLTSVQVAAKSSGQDDNFSTYMSLASDNFSTKGQSHISQEVLKATKLATDHTKEAVDQLWQEFDQAMQQSMRNFHQEL